MWALDIWEKFFYGDAASKTAAEINSVQIFYYRQFVVCKK